VTSHGCSRRARRGGIASGRRGEHRAPGSVRDPASIRFPDRRPRDRHAPAQRGRLQSTGGVHAGRLAVEVVAKWRIVTGEPCRGGGLAARDASTVRQGEATRRIALYIFETTPVVVLKNSTCKTSNDFMRFLGSRCVSCRKALHSFYANDISSVF